MGNPIANVMPAPSRDISEITAEVKELQRQAKNVVLMYAIQIGRNLKEAKAILPHGEWGNWLKNEVDFSQSTANNYMRLYDEYGCDQLSLFGNIANSQSIANLPYTKAMQLLAVPAEDRQEFVDSHPVEDMTVKELQEAIRERDEAREENRAIREEMEVLRSDFKIAANDSQYMRDQIEDLEEKIETQKTCMAELAKAAKDAQKELIEKEKALQESLEVPAERVKEIEEAARIKAEGEAEQKVVEAENKAKKALEDLENRIEAQQKAAEQAAAAEDELKKAQEEKARLEEELEKLKKRADGTDQRVASFKALFVQLQKLAGQMKEDLDKIALDDQDLALKLKRAMKAFGETL